MRKAFFTLTVLFAMMVAGLSARAQEITITLLPGCTWISYTNAEAMSITTALGDFVPMEGDVIKSQYASTTYSHGRWMGRLQQFSPGLGYMYISRRGEPVSFVFAGTVLQVIVTTAEPTDITTASAVVGGTVTAPEGAQVYLRGVCWGTEPDPAIDGNHTSNGAETGSFSAILEGLSPDSIYYVRAYAVTDHGPIYGDNLSFNVIPVGAQGGLFSVRENTQVYFSQGNLQYQASTNTWRFAENQWDYVGEGNTNASSTYDGWIDLFNWGTSGYNHGANCYQPWSICTDYAYGIETCSLFDQTGKADWGYNAISNGGNEEKLWRTLSYDEWHYMLYERETSSNIRFAKAQVSGVNGLIILPDDWDASNYTLNYTNNGDASFDQNNITLDDWMGVFQDVGAAFLPCAGARWEDGYGYSGESGDYWSSTRKQDGDFAYDINLGWVGHSCCNEGGAQSVRLVRPAQTNISYSIEAVSNPAEGGTITGIGTYDYYTQVTLTATANESYTFYQWKENGNVVSTENPYSFVAFFDRNLEAVFLESSTYPLLYSYNEGDHTATVIGRWDGVELTGELVIPETVMHNGEVYTVTAIGDNALRDCSNLTSVEFPSSLVSIGQSAFEVCRNLTSITIPNSVTFIGSWAFSHCNSITEITIPNSVSHIGINPFHDCTNLAQITVELGNLYYDSRNNCNAIIETSSNSLISGSLNTVIPNSVTAICRDAFLQIPITTISIPASVVRMDMSAFALTSLSEITIYAEIPPILNDGPFYGVDKSIPVYVPCASIEAYQNANGWSEFTNFIGIGQCSGIVTVTASPEEYGTVTGGGYYENSATCTVTALPNDGYYFLCWMEDGQGVSTEANYTFPVYRDHNLTAIFYATLGDENIINGDFEQGNVGFTSGYYYNYDFDSPGQYYVDNNTHYPGFGHGGTGNFMMIDGAMEPDVIIWTEQISVVPGTSYTLSAWVCSLNPESLALLQFSINGTQIGDVFTAPSQTNTWQQFSAVWYSGDSTTATITIIDLNTEGNGNDFGLDDISFRELDPSVSGGDDHAYVDLGLPSGLLWATCNVGADNPEDYGDYFAWGETQPKDTYDWSNYQHCNGDYNLLTKYCNNSSWGYNGFTDDLTILLPEDDAATANWGADWRMPTQVEWQELLDNTTCTWTQQNGVNGRLFTASNGNSLFLPAAGFRRSGSPDYTVGRYWSSSLFLVHVLDGCSLDFGSGYFGVSSNDRSVGFSVRPVRSSAQN